MARRREAIGGAVLPPRMALRAAVFQSVTTSALAGVPILDTRFIAPTQAIKIKPLKKALMSTLLSANSGLSLCFIGFLCQACLEPLFPVGQLNDSIPQVNVYHRGAILSAPMRQWLSVRRASENRRLMDLTGRTRWLWRVRIPSSEPLR